MSSSSIGHADRTLDLGEKGCGQLVMEIMLTMRELAPGQILQVIAYDPAAAVDNEAWCRMTGNTVLRASTETPHHQFFLQKGQG